MNTLHILLSQTSHPGNIGAVARAMHACDTKDLHLIDCQSPVDSVAHDRATNHAKHILDNTSHHKNLKSATTNLDIVYAFTNRIRDINLPLMTLEEACTEINALNHTKIGLLFGPERTGLVNHDLQFANRCVYIPCQNSNIAMNLSHAVQTALYVLTHPSLYKTDQTWPTGKQKDAFWCQLNHSLKQTGFYKKDRQHHTEQKIRTIFNRACMNHDELQLIHGMIAALQKDDNETILP